MFGQWQLSSGIGLTAFLMGLFAISEVLSQSGELSGLRITTRVRRVPFIPPKDERDEMWKGITIGSLLGTFTGILPAVGQDTATVLAYNQTKTMSKHPEKFGTGYAAGIAASESSNNAVNGGALIPLCCLGIPGDNVTAALIGGLMIHGLQPGPMLAVDAPEVIGCIMLVYFLANIVMYLMETGLMNIFVQMIRIPKSLLFPAILVCCVLGVYAINNRIFEVLVMVVSGIVAYFLLNYFKLDLIAILLGYLLGPLLETYLRTAMIADQGNLLAFTQHPIALGLIVAAVIVLAGQAFFRKSRRKKLLR
jgi:putative membrane protein